MKEITIPPKLNGINLYLIGMMGCGKSTIGKLLAPQLSYRFVDTDDLITACTNTSIEHIFTQQGEQFFRQLETEVLQEVCSHLSLVIATGGGIISTDRNWSYLHHGIVVWLDVPLEQLWQRLSQSNAPRPLLQNSHPIETLQNLLDARRDRYALADIHVQAGGDPELVCEKIIAQLDHRLKPAPQYPAENTCPQTEPDRWLHRP